MPSADSPLGLEPKRLSDVELLDVALWRVCCPTLLGLDVEKDETLLAVRRMVARAVIFVMVGYEYFGFGKKCE